MEAGCSAGRGLLGNALLIKQASSFCSGHRQQHAPRRHAHRRAHRHRQPVVSRQPGNACCCADVRLPSALPDLLASCWRHITMPPCYPLSPQGGRVPQDHGLPAPHFQVGGWHAQGPAPARLPDPGPIRCGERSFSLWGLGCVAGKLGSALGTAAACLNRPMHRALHPHPSPCPPPCPPQVLTDANTLKNASNLHTLL